MLTRTLILALMMGKPANKNRNKLDFKLSVLFQMLQLNRWRFWPLKLHFLQRVPVEKHICGLPRHIMCTFGSWDRIPYSFDNGVHDEGLHLPL